MALTGGKKCSTSVGSPIHNPKITEPQIASIPTNNIHPYYHQARKGKEPPNSLSKKTGGGGVGRVLVGRINLLTLILNITHYVS